MIGVVMRGAEEERGRSVGQGKTHDDRVSLVVACHREESHSGVAILQGHGRVVVAGSGYVALGENWSKVTCPLPRGKEAGETWGTQRVEVGSVNIAGNQTEVWGRSDGFPAVSSVRTPPAAAEVEVFAAPAPQPLKDEAVIRMVGWLVQVPAGLTDKTVKSPDGSEVTFKYARGMSTASPLRASGASALLARHRRMGAGTISG